MTLEDVPETNMSRKSLCRAVMTVLRKAQSEKRLTCGLLPAIKLLEMDPGSALFCIMPESSQGNAALHIQTVLLQAFCYENDIHIIQVDSAGKLGDIVTGTHDGPRLDSSCVIVHQPWATDQPVLSKSEQQLVRFCHKTLDEFPQPVIKLPGL
ncbi:growth arrest and DNA damage-inducible protein GADD45 gamma [Cryptotermes secundus]|uniref:growth arrest and DNA damage-inducible protein GADD45 gamma n=1 Tax=Cryptotermes secundus TaxID=105785 RepID=UPI000CD7C56E|nr:growth arrest and DNA damage-inducible protein GADD45 gamma [Cryptotermes secundus]